MFEIQILVEHERQNSRSIFFEFVELKRFSARRNTTLSVFNCDG